MSGVESFVAQRQQGYPSSSRQKLGALNRVSVPRMKLEDNKRKQSFNRPNVSQPAGLGVAGNDTCRLKQQATKPSLIQDGFETDAEGFDDTETMSLAGSIRGYEGEEHDRDQKTSCHVTDAAHDIISGSQIPLRQGQGQADHSQGPGQPAAESSKKGADQGNYTESSDEDEGEEVDEELMRDGILQELNSPGFSQYLWEETSQMAQEAFEPMMAVPGAYSSLELRNVVQKLPITFKSAANSRNSGAADLDTKLQRANPQTSQRAMKESSGVPIQKVQGPSMEQFSISARHRQISDHRESSQQASVTSHQTLPPMRVARDTMAKNIKPQAKEEVHLPGQKVSIDLDADNFSVDWGSDVGREHDKRPTASVNSPRTRKRTRDLDYRPDQISSMTFKQLRNEPFDLTCNTVRAYIPKELSSGTINAKMDHIIKRSRKDEAKLEQRRAFFSSLPIEQYDECASIIVGRFGAIMARLTDARQQRRQAAVDFEEEVAKREESIGGKTMVVYDCLSRLKRGGEEVVRGAA